MSGNSWAGKHKGELLAAAAITAAAFTGGASLGLLGAAGGTAAAAGEGAAATGALGAGFGADAAVGAGMGGSAASAFGPTAAQSALATSFMAQPAAGIAAGGMDALPMFTAGEGLGATQALGMPELAMNAGGAPAGLLSQFQGAFPNFGKGLEAFGRVSKAAQVAGLLNQPQTPTPMQPRAQQQVPDPGVQSFMQMYGSPVVDAETLRRRRMQQYGGMG